ncbi:MAG: hypothetical protein II998_07000 [Clostridia bacterium]|nr:hypothetical protein [Clostridia bacterium]
MKKILSLFISLVICIAAFCTPVSAYYANFTSTTTFPYTIDFENGTVGDTYTHANYISSFVKCAQNDGNKYGEFDITTTQNAFVELNNYYVDGSTKKWKPTLTLDFDLRIDDNKNEKYSYLQLRFGNVTQNLFSVDAANNGLVKAGGTEVGNVELGKWYHYELRISQTITSGNNSCQNGAGYVSCQVTGEGFSACGDGTYTATAWNSGAAHSNTADVRELVFNGQNIKGCLDNIVVGEGSFFVNEGLVVHDFEDGSNSKWTLPTKADKAEIRDIDGNKVMYVSVSEGQTSGVNLILGSGSTAYTGNVSDKDKTTKAVFEVDVHPVVKSAIEIGIRNANSSSYETTYLSFSDNGSFYLKGVRQAETYEPGKSYRVTTMIDKTEQKVKIAITDGTKLIANYIVDESEGGIQRNCIHNVNFKISKDKKGEYWIDNLRFYEYKSLEKPFVPDSGKDALRGFARLVSNHAINPTASSVTVNGTASSLLLDGNTAFVSDNSADGTVNNVEYTLCDVFGASVTGSFSYTSKDRIMDSLNLKPIALPMQAGEIAASVYGKSADDLMLVVAAYNDDELTAVKVTDIKAKNISASYEAKIEVESTDTTVKAFLWNCKNLCPADGPIVVGRE